LNIAATAAHQCELSRHASAEGPTDDRLPHFSLTIAAVGWLAAFTLISAMIVEAVR